MIKRIAACTILWAAAAQAQNKAFPPERERQLAREIYKDVKAEETPKTVEQMLKGYLAHRLAPDETFLAFSKRHEIDALKTMFEAAAVE